MVSGETLAKKGRKGYEPEWKSNVGKLHSAASLFTNDLWGDAFHSSGKYSSGIFNSQGKP